MVKNYTDKQLLDRVKSLSGYKSMPYYLLIGVRSQADEFDKYDDKFYFFVNGKFFVMSTGTTNSGSYSLLGGWKKANPHGSAIIKSDEIYYDVYEYGLHRQKMPALRQVKPMKYYRDGDNDKQVDETGTVYTGIYYTNFHFNSYNLLNSIKATIIGRWSEGCAVSNDRIPYTKIIEEVKSTRKPVTFALLKEF
jgi:hypothetical protein